MGTTSPILGIDLGTTMSSAAVFQNGTLTFVENALGETLTPSVVAYDSRSQGLVVGRTAKDILAVHPDLGAALFKRDMGSDAVYTIADKTYSPVDLSAYVLDALRCDAERQLGTVVDRCVVTVPAYFSEAQRHATRQAAHVAGFAVERIVNEPTAAAMAHGLHEGDDDASFVILDLGGGTFDVCVMERFEGLLEVRGVSGASQLGGEDFTMAIAQLGLRLAQVDAKALDLRALTALRRRAEMLKRKLSRWPSADMQVPTGAEHEETIVTIHASDAADAFRPLLERMVGPCRSALRGADVTPADLSEVVLVGGATRMPCIATLAGEIFGVTPRVHDDPDRLVTRGAAIQAALCAKDESVSDIVVTDVASHTLGLATSKEVLGRRTHGHFAPIIERNAVIPTSHSGIFGTVLPNQSEITLEVYEGESRKVTENRKLGEIEVTGIPPGLPGEAVDVRFTYDMNGILEVEATVLATGQKHAQVFQRSGTRLEGEALQTAMDKLQRLKADPRVRPRYRDLLARANALWSEVNEHEREQLAYAADVLEVALLERRQGDIDAAFSTLSQYCSQLDQGERW